MPDSIAAQTLHAEGHLVLTENNTLEGVNWLLSYVSVDNRRWFCLYDGPSPESIRRAASRNKLPIHGISEIRVLDPYAVRQK